MPISLKLYICFCHGLKICMWFEYNPDMYFCHFLLHLDLVIFQARILTKYVDTWYLVCATPSTLLHIMSIALKIYMFLSWSEDVRVVWILPSDNFLLLFQRFELVALVLFLFCVAL